MRIAVLNDLHVSTQRRNERLASHLALESLERCLERIQKVSPDMIVLLGDLVQNTSLEHDEEQLRQVIRRLVPFREKTVFTMGNHESRELGFNRVQEILASENMDYHLFGRRRFSDGEALWLSSLQIGREPQRRDFLPDDQKEWLWTQLPQLELPTIVFMHHSFVQYDMNNNFYYEMGGRNDLMHILNEPEVTPRLLAAPQVQATVSGHAHWLSYLERGGVPLITLPAHSENIAAPHVSENVPDIWSLVETDGPRVKTHVFSGQYAFAYLETQRH